MSSEDLASIDRIESLLRERLTADRLAWPRPGSGYEADLCKALGLNQIPKQRGYDAVCEGVKIEIKKGRNHFWFDLVRYAEELLGRLKEKSDTHLFVVADSSGDRIKELMLVPSDVVLALFDLTEDEASRLCSLHDKLLKRFNAQARITRSRLRGRPETRLIAPAEPVRTGRRGKRTSSCQRVFGVDFTSRPSVAKPIVVVEGCLSNLRLDIYRLDEIITWPEFEAFLATPGPWRAGFDFPFGQPDVLLKELGLQGDWRDCVLTLTRGGKESFEQLLREYKAKQPSGSKHHLRRTDQLAGGQSPMTLDYTPVGKMFFEGSRRLLAAGLSVLPTCPTADMREAVEAYPKLVARRYIGSHSYKSERASHQTVEQRDARGLILQGLAHDARASFGFDVSIADRTTDRAIADGSGDTIDSILCAVQAAWSLSCKAVRNGIPNQVNFREGWIVDPSLLSSLAG